LLKAETYNPQEFAFFTKFYLKRSIKDFNGKKTISDEPRVAQEFAFCLNKSQCSQKNL